MLERRSRAGAGGVVVVIVVSLLAGCRSSAPARGQVADAAARVDTSGRSYTRPSASELHDKLSPLAFEVTQHAATEPPFKNAFWNNHEAGIYVDVATGEPLFSSLDKFESGTGWPSFTRPIEDGRVTTRSDETFGMVRTEARSSSGQSHLGHVFDDGPGPTGMRYCINSAALRFIPLARLAAEGYAAYAARFTGGASEAPIVATANSCAMPAPGERPGCEATLETAELEGGDGAAASLRRIDGVLEVERKGKRYSVTFDPARIARADLLARWASAGGAGGQP